MRPSRALAAPLAALTLACSGDAPDAPAAPVVEPAPVTAADSADRVLRWLGERATPLARTAPVGAVDDAADLRALVQAVGGARVVGMGEGTHGSGEFFTVKDRVFRALVREAGFTGIAVEATMPEAFALDHYVRTGQGDARALLRGLYFWTTGTEELLTLVEWLRVHNAAQPAERRVGFYGVDMQYPAAALDSVRAFARRVAPDALGPFVAARYACADQYRNDGRLFPAGSYSVAPGALRTTCGPAVRAVHDTLAALRPSLGAGAAQEAYERALLMARLVVQWEGAGAAAATGGAKEGAAARDAAMAENVGWLLQRHGTGGRLLLWAHNAHVGVIEGGPARTDPPLMLGGHLRRTLGAGYAAVGFAFDRGGVNAWGPQRFEAHTMPAAVDGSAEAVLRRHAAAAYYVDLRTAPPASAVAAWLDGRRPVRTVGSGYDPAFWDRYFRAESLRTLYDVLVFVTTVTPSRPLFDPNVIAP